MAADQTWHVHILSESLWFYVKTSTKIILRNVAFSRSSTWESMINFYSTKNWLENSPAGVNLCLEEFEFVWFFYKQASKARTRACLISKNDLEAQLSPISRKQLKPSGNSFSLLCSTSFLGLWHPVHVSLTMVFFKNTINLHVG